MSDLESILNSEHLLQLVSDIENNQITHGPFYIEIHLIDRCNLACYFCNQTRFRKHGGYKWDFSSLSELIVRLSEQGLHSIRLSGGGEPTLYPFLCEVLDLTSRLGISISRFTTNGLALTTSISQKLIESELKVLHISLQAPTPHSWSTITRRDSSGFQEVLRNIKSFAELNNRNQCFVFVSFIIDTATIEHLPEMFSLAKSLGVHPVIHDLNSHTYSDHILTNCMPDLMGYLETLDRNHLKCFRFNTLMEPMRYLNKRLSREDKEPNSAVCLAPWTSFMVKANGSVYPCCGIQSESSILGNVLFTDVIDLWQGDAFSELRNEGRHLFFGEARNTTNRLELNFLQESCLGNCSVRNGMLGLPYEKTRFSHVKHR